MNELEDLSNKNGFYTQPVNSNSEDSEDDNQDPQDPSLYLEPLIDQDLINKFDKFGK